MHSFGGVLLMPWHGERLLQGRGRDMRMLCSSRKFVKNREAWLACREDDSSVAQENMQSSAWRRTEMCSKDDSPSQSLNLPFQQCFQSHCEHSRDAIKLFSPAAAHACDSLTFKSSSSSWDFHASAAVSGERRCTGAQDSPEGRLLDGMQAVFFAWKSLAHLPAPWVHLPAIPRYRESGTLRVQQVQSAVVQALVCCCSRRCRLLPARSGRMMMMPWRQRKKLRAAGTAAALLTMLFSGCPVGPGCAISGMRPSNASRCSVLPHAHLRMGCNLLGKEPQPDCGFRTSATDAVCFSPGLEPCAAFQCMQGQRNVGHVQQTA